MSRETGRDARARARRQPCTRSQVRVGGTARATYTYGTRVNPARARKTSGGHEPTPTRTIQWDIVIVVNTRATVSRRFQKLARAFYCRRARCGLKHRSRARTLVFLSDILSPRKVVTAATDPTICRPLTVRPRPGKIHGLEI